VGPGACPGVRRGRARDALGPPLQPRRGARRQPRALPPFRRCPRSNTRFLVTDAAGKPVTAVCPGATYTVTVSRRGAPWRAWATTWVPARLKPAPRPFSTHSPSAPLRPFAHPRSSPSQPPTPQPHPHPHPQLTFPEKRLALLTASAGAWAKPGDDECPNRVFFDRSSGFASETKQSMALTVPCNRAGGGPGGGAGEQRGSGGGPAPLQLRALGRVHA
jgi:hypothetical protein